MRSIFADTYYWVALLNDKDEGHRVVQELSLELGDVTIVTTEEVLIEVLAYFGEKGLHLRKVATRYVRNILNIPDVLVRHQSQSTFLDGLNLYESRPDKGYSLTDFISMQAMRAGGLGEVLTHDAHFAQEGFAILL